MRVVICHAVHSGNRGTFVIVNDFYSSTSFMRGTCKKVSKKKAKKFLIDVGINIEREGCSFKIDLEKINRVFNEELFWHWKVYLAYSVKI